jgi:hypothetical protein
MGSCSLVFPSIIVCILCQLVVACVTSLRVTTITYYDNIYQQ